MKSVVIGELEYVARHHEAAACSAAIITGGSDLYLEVDAHETVEENYENTIHLSGIADQLPASLMYDQLRAERPVVLAAQIVRTDETLKLLSTDLEWCTFDLSNFDAYSEDPEVATEGFRLGHAGWSLEFGYGTAEEPRSEVWEACTDVLTGFGKGDGGYPQL